MKRFLREDYGGEIRARIISMDLLNHPSKLVNKNLFTIAMNTDLDKIGYHGIGS